MLFAVFPLVYSVTISEHSNHNNIQAFQNNQGLLETEAKKIELEISDKILHNNITSNILANPQDSGIIILDYLNGLIQEIAAESSIYDIIGFSIGMVIYGIFVYHFYRFLSKRDIFSINIEKRIAEGKFKSSGKKASAAPRAAAFIATNFFIFPFVIFLWFIGYSSFMFMLVQNMPTSTIFLISSGLIIAIRISAYYSEELSRDIAKLLPFALLGIFLFNPQFYSFSDILSRLLEMPSFVIQIASFIILAMAVEIVLSILYLIKIRFFRKEHIDKADDYMAAV
ncbi:MAG: hypothetical protein OEM18_07520 [Nitrosopumilus sp.]|nr:hypothetical protein [Nitrosopumilus sp.]MDH3502719.1 hypothetical protein [Nitrosopumilus sp.]